MPRNGLRNFIGNLNGSGFPVEWISLGNRTGNGILEMGNNMTTTTDYWFNTIDEIKRANADAGLNWFAKETMRFFGSRIGSAVYGGRYFVSSEQDNYGNGDRRYTVRLAEANGQIETVGEFCQYATRSEAVRAINALLRK